MSLKLTPFRALYGYSPPQFGLHAAGTIQNPLVDDYLHHRTIMTYVLRQSLLTAQHRMKQQADKGRIERSFIVRDWVYLRLQPYRHTSVQLRKNLKLAAKFFGPYKVLERVGNVAYRLELPISSRIHPVLHVSQLKKKIRQGFLPQTVLPTLDKEGLFKVGHVKVLSTRVLIKGRQQIPQVQVQWSHTAEGDATWEDTAFIRSSFPKFILEDKDVL
ncbi:uncharacterized protein LOC113346042 [Papaver somniferum]|uniref:uncharacterized protein LOC113346042 n=1 Tax=Papaver somniferum TaxID=3469 RepID=UPI000E6FA487|nr:uncharacterized protein LOC113346042 [Papaver somniferum]